MSGDLKSALRLVWFAVSLMTGVAVVAPFVLPAATVQRLAPRCESKRRYGRECFLCGATTGFIAVSQGDFRSASRSNALAIPLFAAFFSNAAAAAAYLIWRARARGMR